MSKYKGVIDKMQQILQKSAKMSKLNDNKQLILDHIYQTVSQFKRFYRKKVKTVDYSETIAACDLKVGRCRQLIE